MSPPLRCLAAAAALSGMLAPWTSVIVTAAHVTADHHGFTDEHDHFDASALHGHGHSADTPDHEHGLSLPGATDGGLRPPVMGIPLAVWAGFFQGWTSPCPFVPAPAASPPRLASIVLRI